jgi:CRP-like cAMP-binding protein
VQAVNDELRIVMADSAATETTDPSPIDAIATQDPSDHERSRSALASVPLFSSLEPEAIESLEAFTFRKRFEPGEIIVEEGRTGNGLYVVLSGKVEVVKGLDGPRPQTLAVFGPGEPFGEMALLADWKRSASVRAIDEVECLGMDRWAFLVHLNREPQLAIKMVQMLAQRLAETNERLAE